MEPRSLLVAATAGRAGPERPAPAVSTAARSEVAMSQQSTNQTLDQYVI